MSTVPTPQLVPYPLPWAFSFHHVILLFLISVHAAYATPQPYLVYHIPLNLTYFESFPFPAGCRPGHSENGTITPPPPTTTKWRKQKGMILLTNKDWPLSCHPSNTEVGSVDKLMAMLYNTMHTNLLMC